MKRRLPRYNANPLIDAAIKSLGLRSDADLSRAIGISRGAISHIRRGDLPAGPSILVLLSESMDMPVRELRALMTKTELKGD